MIGVFISFTLSQSGMVIHWRRHESPGWKTSALDQRFRALVTGIVLIIVAITKTLEGAWIVLLLIPIMITVFRGDAPTLRSRRLAALAAKTARRRRACTIRR